jgi:hypothetical protein
MSIKAVNYQQFELDHFIQWIQKIAIIFYQFS